MSVNAIDRITKAVESFNDGTHETICPGQPFRIPSSWQDGDAGAQGDLVFVVCDKVPEGYAKVEKLTELNRQLVVGNTQGSKHCLDSFEGVEMWHPATWNGESLDGPYLRVSQDRVVDHPTHGAWTIPAGCGIKLEYPRVWDKEQKAEARNKD